MKKRLLAMLLIASMAVSTPQPVFATEITTENQIISESVMEDEAIVGEASENNSEPDKTNTSSDEIDENEETFDNEEKETFITEADELEVNENKVIYYDTINNNIINCQKAEDGFYSFNIEEGELLFKYTKNGLLNYQVFAKVKSWKKETNNIYLRAWMVVDNEYCDSVSLNYTANATCSNSFTMLDPEKQYKLFFTVFKGSECIGKLSIDSKTEQIITTPKTDDDVVITNVRKAGTYIAFDIEKVNKSIRSISIDELNTAVVLKSDFNDSVLFDSLVPDKTYDFTLRDINGKVISVKQYSTNSSNSKSNKVSITQDNSCFSYNASFELKDYRYSTFSSDSIPTVYYRVSYKDDYLMHEAKSNNLTVTKDSSTGEWVVSSGSIPSVNLPGYFTAGKTYNFKVELISNYSYVLFTKDISVKANAAGADSNSKLDINVRYSESENLLYVKTASSNIAKNTPVRIGYIYNGIDGFNKASYSPRVGGEEVQEYYVLPGVPFTLYAYVGGKVFKKDYTFGKKSIEIKRVNNGSNKTYADGISRTYQLVSSEKINGSYVGYISLENVTLGTEYNLGRKFDTEFTKDNNYTSSCSLSGFNYFKPGCRYKIKYTIYNADDKCVCTSNEYVDIPYVGCSLSYDPNEMYKITAKFSNLSEDSSGFWAEYTFTGKDGVEESTYRVIDIDKADAYSVQLPISYTAPGDSKTLKFYNYSDHSLLCTAKFTAPAKEYSLKAQSISTTSNVITGKFILTGKAGSREYNTFYLRQTGGKWENINKEISFNQGEEKAVELYAYQGMTLKENTEYEIAYGPSAGFNIYDSNTYAVISAKTKADDRVIKIYDSKVSYSTAKLCFNYKQNAANRNNSLTLLYRKKGSSAWTLLENQTKEFENTNIDSNLLFNISGLTKGTEYEYKIEAVEDFLANDVVSAKEPKILSQGSFETLVGDYKLSFVPDTKNSTTTVEILKVIGKPTKANDDYVNVDFVVNNKTYSTSLYKCNDYTSTVEIAELQAATNYPIKSASVISADGQTIQALNFSDIGFTTKATLAPKSITLNEKAYVLNLLGANTKTLFVTKSSPVGCEADVIWSTSNTAVATVTSTGQVKAVAAGEAIITAKSKYNENVQATCNITVKNYYVGKYESNTFTNYGGIRKTINRNPGQRVKFNFYFYELINSKYIKIDDVKFDCKQPSVVTYDQAEKAFYAVGNGKATVYCNYKNISIPVYFTIGYTQNYSVEISGVSATGEYPSILDENNEYILATGSKYIVNLSSIPSTITPVLSDFTISSSNTKAAIVDSEGNITAVAAGKSVITFKKADGNEAKVTVNVKNLPASVTGKSISALLNTQKKLSDISLSEINNNWQWLEPNTALTHNASSTGEYTFPVIYAGTDKYPIQENITVKVCKINGVDFFAEGKQDENSIIIDDSSNETIIKYAPSYSGVLYNSLKFELLPSNGLTLTKKDDYTWSVKAKNFKTYKLTGNLYTEVNGKKVVLASNKHNVIVTNKLQSQEINATFSQNPVVEITDNNIIVRDLSYVKDVKNFVITPQAFGSASTKIDSTFTFKSSNAAVCTITPAKDKKSATIYFKNYGTSTITVTANDLKKTRVTYNVSINDFTPIISTTAITVNRKILRSSQGEDEIIRLGNNISLEAAIGSTLAAYPEIYDDKDCKTVSNNFELHSLSSEENVYTIYVRNSAVKNGKYTVYFNQPVYDGAYWSDYVFPIKINLISEVPSVKLKLKKAMNLFFKNSAAEYSIVCSKNCPRVSVATSSTKYSLGTVRSSIPGNDYITVKQSNVEVINGKLAPGYEAEKIKIYASGYGYIDELNLKIDTVYKKPSLSSRYPSTTVNFEKNKLSKGFTVYDDSAKTTCEITSAKSLSAGVSAEKYSIFAVRYTVGKNFKPSTVSICVDNDNWREPLIVKHTIKLEESAPFTKKATLTKTSAVINKQLGNASVSTSVSANGYWYNNVSVTGANTAATELLASDKLIVSNADGYVNFETSDVKNIKPGTYSFKLVASDTNPSTGKTEVYPACTYTIKVIDEKVTPEVTVAGKVNIISSGYDTVLTTNFKNVNKDTRFYLDSIKLKGAYSSAFSIRTKSQYSTNELYASSGMTHEISRTTGCKLEANKKYQLYLEYTLKLSDGSKNVVTSKPFYVSTTKVIPKIVTQELSLNSCVESRLTASTTVDIPYGFAINNASGEYDINKDGNSDIKVSIVGNTLKASIVNRYVLPKNSKGTVYAIPLNIKFTGSDSAKYDNTIKVNVRVY